MIIWLNGAQGAAASAVARELADVLPGGTVFDPERVTRLLRETLPGKRLAEVDDCRELPAWRWLVVEAAAALHRETGAAVLVPLALRRQAYRDEIFGGLASRGLAVRHLLLCEETILLDRDPPDPHGPESSWLQEDAFAVDVSGVSARGAAERIAGALAAGAGARDIVQSAPPRGATVAAGMLLFDAADRVLLVDPTYKPGWEFPGGVVEPGEAPARAAVREVAEELGLRLPEGPALLVVDWEPPEPPRHGGLRMLFDGGRLTPERLAEVTLPDAELRAWRLVGVPEAERLLSPGRFARLRWALRARARGRSFNLEAGVPVGD